MVWGYRSVGRADEVPADTLAYFCDTQLGIKSVVEGKRM